MSDIVVNDVFEELNEENKRLKQLINVLIKYKSFCDLIVDKNKLNLNLDSSDYQKHQELGQEFSVVFKKIKYKDNNASDSKSKTETKISFKYHSNKLTAIRAKTLVKKSIRHSLKTRSTIDADGLHVCDFVGCGKRYKTRDSLRSHLRKHTSTTLYVCEYPGCDWSHRLKHYYISHMMAHKNIRPYECGYCGKAFTADRYLNNHIDIIHKEADEPLVCGLDDCIKVFKNEHSLKNHQRSNHLREKKFPCTEANCPFRGISEAVVRQHVYNVHSDERPFGCSIEGCSKTFKSADKLREHERCHLPDRPFKCEFPGCDKAYKTRSTANKHYRNNHGNELMQCLWPGCDYITKNQKLLNGHSLSHKSERTFSCTWPECNKKFKRVQSLTTHMRIHTNERRYACDWPGCQYRCTDNGNLFKHKRVHQKNMECVKYELPPRPFI